VSSRLKMSELICGNVEGVLCSSRYTWAWLEIRSYLMWYKM